MLLNLLKRSDKSKQDIQKLHFQFKEVENDSLIYE